MNGKCRRVIGFKGLTSRFSFASSFILHPSSFPQKRLASHQAAADYPCSSGADDKAEHSYAAASWQLVNRTPEAGATTLAVRFSTTRPIVRRLSESFFVSTVISS
jgi:hypothetical protein